MFDGFFLAGFECATGHNVNKNRIDQIAATQHDRFALEDYRRLTELGISAAREAVRWPLVDRRGLFDFSSLDLFIEAGSRFGITQIWDLFHFGYPEDVDLFAPDFSRRFADYCYATARYIAARSEGPLYFTPINEPSYFSWAAGEAGLFAPHQHGRGWELKVCLVRALIESINAIRAACPDAHIVNADSLCRVVAPPGDSNLEREAADFNSKAVFQSWDILSGRLLPELGGSPRHLDIVGINYYWTNQWEIHCPGVPLSDTDPRRWPLSRLMRSVWERYGHEILITETSHVDEMRPVWMRELAFESEKALSEGLPLLGVCLYPVLGMPEWHAPERWTRMGLWDLVDEDGTLVRYPHLPMIEALRDAQNRLEPFTPAISFDVVGEEHVSLAAD
jgi:beta-glucosidase/6-phospho-beta-glucosidase/beta-galactosidase